MKSNNSQLTENTIYRGLSVKFMGDANKSRQVGSGKGLSMRLNATCQQPLAMFYFCKMAVLLLALLSFTTQGADPLVVRHYQVQERYTFGIELLKLALSKLEQPYQLVAPESQEMNEGRGSLLVQNGMLDLQFLSSTPEREKQFHTVKIPIYRGLLGLRLLLVKRQGPARMAQVNNLSMLRQFKGTHGKHWGDLPVYHANDLPVITHIDYNKLFELVIKGRADYFHRGLSEIWPEQAKYNATLIVEPHLMLYYPQPVYYFVTPQKPELAAQIEKGLQLATEDGSYRRLFDQFYAATLSQANLASRTLILLKNPDVPDQQAQIDTSWWMPAELQRHFHSSSRPKKGP